MSKSIYKTQEGRATMAGWYEHFLGRLAPAPVRFEEVDTRFGRTNILIAGEEGRPALWCFHGAMASAPAALAQVPWLLERFQIFFPDTIGQPGRSAENRLDWQGQEHGWWVCDVLDAMGEESVQAIGVSLGGYVLLRTAQVAPRRIHRAVLWVPGGLIKPPMGDMFGLIWDGLLYALRPNQARLEKIMLRTFTDLDDDYVAFFADSLKHVHPDRRFPATLPDGALDGWDAPVMLITHGQDGVFPAEALKARAATMIPKLDEQFHLPGVKHMPPFAPGKLDGLRASLEAFLQ